MNEFQAIDRLGNAPAQYLMVAAIVALLVFGWKVFQKLLELHAKQEDKTAQAQKQTDEVRQKWETASERFALAIERNTHAFEKTEQELRECQNVNTRAREILVKFQ